MLIHANYLSKKDVEICLDFDINILADRPAFTAIKALFDTFVLAYKADAT